MEKSTVFMQNRYFWKQVELQNPKKSENWAIYLTLLKNFEVLLCSKKFRQKANLRCEPDIFKSPEEVHIIYATQRDPKQPKATQSKKKRDPLTNNPTIVL